MKKNYWIHLIVFCLLLSGTVNASNAITVSDGYIKASIPGSEVTAAYMTINNSSNEVITLKRVTSTISDRVEIHEHSMADGMMRMREVGKITIEANSSVVLQPSGLHLMFFSLTQPIIENNEIDLTLHFSNNTKIKIQLPVYKYK